MGDEEVKAALQVLAESGRKFVPESDLIGAKKSLESKIAEAQSTIESLQAELDAKHQTLLRETAAREAAEKSAASLSKLEETVKELKQQLAEATTGRDHLHQQMVGLKRLQVAQLAKEFGSELTADQLATKTEQQLDSLLEALKLVKVPARPGFDGGAGGTGAPTPKTGRQLIKEGLKALG